MLARSPDPSIDPHVADQIGSCIEPLLLGHLVGMIKVELVYKLVERHRKIGGSGAGELGDLC